MSDVIRIAADEQQQCFLNRKLRVAVYARVSSHEREYSNNSQVSYYEKMINENPMWSMAGIYSDVGVSGTGVKDRKEFKRLLKDCFSGKIDMIITKSISRFARNTLTTLQYVKRLREIGVDVYFESKGIHTLTLEGEQELTDYANGAQEYVFDASMNVKEGKRYKINNGQGKRGFRCTGYGHNIETGEVYIIESEAKIVKEIFGLYLEGYGVALISQILNEKGYRTIKNNPWNDGGVLKVLKNEMYIGDVTFNKLFVPDPLKKNIVKNLGEVDMVTVHFHHPAIIERSDFEKVQKKLGTRNTKTRGKHTTKRELTENNPMRLKVKCIECGRNFVVRKQYMKCIGKLKGNRCTSSTTIRMQLLERGFIEAMRIMYDSYEGIFEELIHYVEAVLCSKGNESLLQQQNKLRKNKEDEMKILDLFLDGLITEDEFSNKSSDLVDEKNKICYSISELENRYAEKNYAVDKIKAIQTYFANSSMPNGFDQELFQNVVSKVLVGDFDKIQENEPFKLTYVLGMCSEEWINEEIEDDIYDHIIIGSFMMKSGFYYYKKNGNSKDKVFIKDIKVEIAVNTLKNERSDVD